MGYNTVVIVLNDALNQIEEDPDFGKKLVKAIGERQIGDRHRDVSAGYHSNAASVIGTAHADFSCLVATGGNTARLLGAVHNGGRYHNDAELDGVLRRVMRDLGYRLSRMKRPPDVVEKVATLDDPRDARIADLERQLNETRAELHRLQSKPES